LTLLAILLGTIFNAIMGIAGLWIAYETLHWRKQMQVLKMKEMETAGVPVDPKDFEPIHFVDSIRRIRETMAQWIRIPKAEPV
jgi:hypothetical protein